MNITLKHPKDGYLVKYILKDNNKIFKRDSWLNESLDKCVYVFCEKANVINKIPFLGNIYGIIKYIGCGKWNQFDIFNSRPFTHHDDNLSNLLSKNYTCWVLTGLTNKESHVLEAFLIKNAIDSGFILSKRKKTYKIIPKGQLINKIREKRWEKEISNILLLENQW